MLLTSLDKFAVKHFPALHKKYPPKPPCFFEHRRPKPLYAKALPFQGSRGVANRPPRLGCNRRQPIVIEPANRNLLRVINRYLLQPKRCALRIKPVLRAE